MPVVVGGTGYTGVGTAAYLHITAATTPDGPCGEIGGFLDHGMPCSFLEQPFEIQDGYMNLPKGPGLGVTINKEVLKDFTESQNEWS